MAFIMKTACLASLLLLAAPTAMSQGACPVALKTMTVIGCFSSGDPLVNQGSYTFQSAGYCQCQCAQINKPVMATTKGSDCYCGDLLPPTSSVASNSSCNSPCDGYGAANCGGEGFWSVALTGIESSVGSESGSGSPSAAGSSQTSTSTQTHSPSVVTQAGQTVVVTAPSTAGAGSSGSGPNKAAIAAGVVVGLIAIAAIVGGIVFYMRQRRRREVEDEFKRTAAVNQFVAGKKEGGPTNDARLDPSIMQHRRQSIGSIADERDFSRRILQVRKPSPLAVLRSTHTVRCGIRILCSFCVGQKLVPIQQHGLGITRLTMRARYASPSRALGHGASALGSAKEYTLVGLVEHISR
jgi:cell wall integrity and stress response component